ncbi:hypothetical protein PLESTM_001896600 [Pleodorina starrii]|nr:hypothetical protein PLESTM_001896600 [Pleodorina starrii]
MNPVEPKQRSPTQFHWDNNGYDTFEDILGDLKHSKRKRIRQALEESISRRLPRVEAGAQGEHILQRGYLPSLPYRESIGI